VRSADTTPEARAVQLAVHRGLAGSQRLAIAIAMSEDLNAIAASGADWRARAPEDSATAPT